MIGYPPDGVFNDKTQNEASFIASAGSHSHTITVSNSVAANASSAHNNVQPTIILNYIIKT